MNDKAGIAIQQLPASELKDNLLAYERMYSTAHMPWTQAKILREEVTQLAMAFLKQIREGQ
jgi:hypothetical protein